MPIPLPTVRDARLSFANAPQKRHRTKHVVVHHTAGSTRQSVVDIHAFHRSKGWIGCGYNVVQDEHGAWWQGRGLDRVGAHASGHNSDTVGVSLAGNFETVPVPPHRWASLVEMVAGLCHLYGLSADDVLGHKELKGAATLCPGKHLDMDRLRADVRDALREDRLEGVIARRDEQNVVLAGTLASAQTTADELAERFLVTGSAADCAAAPAGRAEARQRATAVIDGLTETIETKDELLVVRGDSAIAALGYTERAYAEQEQRAEAFERAATRYRRQRNAAIVGSGLILAGVLIFK